MRGLLKLIDGGASAALLDGFGLFDVVDLSLEELSLFLHFVKFLFEGGFLYFYILAFIIFLCDEIVDLLQLSFKIIDLFVELFL